MKEGEIERLAEEILEQITDISKRIKSQEQALQNMNGLEGAKFVSRTLPGIQEKAQEIKQVAARLREQDEKYL